MSSIKHKTTEYRVQFNNLHGLDINLFGDQQKIGIPVILGKRPPLFSATKSISLVFLDASLTKFCFWVILTKKTKLFGLLCGLEKILQLC